MQDCSEELVVSVRNAGNDVESGATGAFVDHPHFSESVLTE
jgi:hypothetical protein